MLIYDRNIVTEGGTGLEEELISKKELLEQYQISYGALYRWKRMGLIPEGWFLRRSAPTGQETYFRRAQICPRIELILQMFPGDEQLVLVFEDTGRRAAARCCVHPALVEELRELAGPGNVAVTEEKTR